ncbi:MAG: hypothetical protein AB2A00_00735 [Myxococcota bacterium]
MCGPVSGECVNPCPTGNYCGPYDACCAADEFCHPQTLTCEGECAPGVPPCGAQCCDAGTLCDVATNTCVPTCDAPRVTCGSACCDVDEVCDVATRTCNPSCPASQQCGPVCCPASQVCAPTTGVCVNPCPTEFCGPADECCAGGTRCIDNACLTDVGGCTTDNECQGDSYCYSGTCIPYDEGPRANGTTPECTRLVPLGLFAPTIQCEWAGPPPADPFPSHANVLVTPLVMDFDFDNDPTTLHPSVVFTTYNFTDGSQEACAGIDNRYYGVIRIIDGNTCQTQFTLADHKVIGSGTPAIADLDGDGRPEIIAPRADPDGAGAAVGGGIVIYRYNAGTGQWTSTLGTTTTGATSTWASGRCNWAGVSVFDVDGAADGRPEIVLGGYVYRHTGVEHAAGPGWLTTPSTGQIPVVLNVDGDAELELVSGDRIYRWDGTLGFTPEAYSPTGMAGGFVAVADFGSFELTPGVPDPGYPEVVTVGAGNVTVRTIHGRVVFGPVALPTPPGYRCSATVGRGYGGPPTIGDFDGDGVPEIAVAGAGAYAVFDLFECAGPTVPAGCYDVGIRWATLSQDCSSNRTGSSIFDFEADGRVEAVYADECYARVYDGVTGEVLFSQAHSSCTWYENVIVADTDGDYRSDLLVPSNTNCTVSCAAVDPVHPGLRCETDADCPAFTGCVAGYCRCSTNQDCPANSGLRCEPPLAGTPGSGNVCRAYHQGSVSGVRIYRDIQDRWVNSRAVWNQHAYFVTNIDDDGVVPPAGSIAHNWATPGLNNFRQNVQGNLDPLASPDLTSRAGGQVVDCSSGSATLGVAVCNRGAAPIAAGLPVAFYLGDPRQGGTLACTTTTASSVTPTACLTVTCAIPVPPSGSVDVWVRADDDGSGTGEASECFEDNNLARFPELTCDG